MEVLPRHLYPICRSTTRTCYMLVLAGLCFLHVELDAHSVSREITDDDGNVYIGELRDNVKHGVGRMEWADGQVYEGDFKNGLIHGEGTITLPSGEAYTGTFEREVRHGYGVLTRPNGDVYRGTFVKGQLTGEGSYEHHVSGDRYEGFFRNGERHGLGVLVAVDGERYEGGFRSDEKNGYGILRQIDGSEYRGFFSNNLRHGSGVLNSQANGLTFQTWDRGELVAEQPIAATENCYLEVDGKSWMFSGDGCVDGLAHGTGSAVSLDGDAYIANGKFVLGRLAVGAVVSLEDSLSD